MQKKETVLLLSNFREDKQFSMLQFGELLLENAGFCEDFTIKNIFPSAVLAKISLSSKVVKWASYIDKYVIFPQRLAKYLKQNRRIGLVHVIDQSNSPYLKTVKKFSSAKRLVTCHDLIAIRTAQRDFPYAPKTSATGKRLQNWIQGSLPLADFYACDSEETQKDLNRIVPLSSKSSKVIHLGTDSNSSKRSDSNYLDSFLGLNPSETNYLLHVGSAAWYKNRTAVLKSFFHSKNQPYGKNLKLILVGPPPQPDEINAELCVSLKKYSSDVICLENISRVTLNHLYLHAKLLLFPSFIEGFGWPPLEAANMGCSVITTKTGAIHELLGDNTRYVDPVNQESINKAVTDELEETSTRRLKVSLPSNQQCRENYFQLYRRLLQI